MALIVLTACGGPTTGAADDGGSLPTLDPPVRTSDLTVTSSFRPSASGGLYVEGAVMEVLLVDSDGTTVGSEAAGPGQPVTFENVSPGTYTIKPALRTCDGNCGELDGRTDLCQLEVALPKTQRVHVDFVVGAPCTFRR